MTNDECLVLLYLDINIGTVQYFINGEKNVPRLHAINHVTFARRHWTVPSSGEEGTASAQQRVPVSQSASQPACFMSTKRRLPTQIWSDQRPVACSWLY